jgi:uncharacterized protein YbbC (DUF1343 family)
VNIIVLDRNVLDAPEMGIEIASALHTLYPANWESNKMLELFGNQAAFNELVAGEDPRRINQELLDQIQAFEQIRKKFLIY